MDPKPLETYYYYYLPSQDRMILHTEIWPKGEVRDMCQAKCWLEAKAQLSLRWPYLELSAEQEYFLKEYHHG